MKTIFRLKNIYLALLPFFSLLLMSCGEDTVKPNSAPVIDQIVVPEKITAGETIELQVIGYDIDGDSIVYTWKVSAGKLHPRTFFNSIKWVAPTDEKSAKITVYATDSKSAPTDQSIVISIEAEPQREVEPPTQPPLPEQPTSQPQPSLPEQPPQQPLTIEPDPPIQQPLDAARNKETIVPGIALAGVRLGDTLEEVERLYGKPRIRDNIFVYGALGFGGTLENNRVEMLAIIDPTFLRPKTEMGNTLGSPRVSVEKEFGISLFVEDGQDEQVFWYMDQGINFRYDENNRVNAITVFRSQ